MSGRVLAVNIAEQNALGGTDTYLAGCSEAQIPPEVLETLGDHVWATDGVEEPVGIEAQKAAAGTNRVIHPDGQVENVTPDAAGGATPDFVLGSEQLAEKTVPELEELCRDRGLPHSGTKAELIARLVDGE